MNKPMTTPQFVDFKCNMEVMGFTVTQVDHSQPITSFADLPDFSLQATKSSTGVICIGFFKLSKPSLDEDLIDIDLVIERLSKALNEALVEAGFQGEHESENDTGPKFGFRIDHRSNGETISSTLHRILGRQFMSQDSLHPNHCFTINIGHGSVLSVHPATVESMENWPRSPYAPVIMFKASFAGRTVAGGIRVDIPGAFRHHFINWFDHQNPTQLFDEILQKFHTSFPYLEGQLTDLEFVPPMD